MRAVVQRVASAKVEVAGEVVGEIGRGLLVYLGAGKADTDADRAYVLSKVLGLRIFSNDEGKMDLGVEDVSGALLVVSQFTLYGDVRKGRRPSFDGAMGPAEAEQAYESFVREARARGITVATGRFRADMKVASVNDGPVTIWIDSEKSA
ncbi:MAG: D-tyrosyl-tRNA(Tyr) deacylase [Labilithrix sp.]|nr:D-tyrosyl-tRNA(Tyr) deacylase [Labilithrix sp.]